MSLSERTHCTPLEIYTHFPLADASDCRPHQLAFTLPIMAATSTQTGPVSKRRKFVADGVFYAELNEFFQRELAEEGYSGVEVRVTPTVTDISM